MSNFWIKLKLLWLPYRQKMAAGSEDLLFGDDFDAVLAISHSYCYSGNEKITIDQKTSVNVPCASLST